MLTIFNIIKTSTMSIIYKKKSSIEDFYNIKINQEVLK